jgi:hypothetical protein
MSLILIDKLFHVRFSGGGWSILDTYLIYTMLAHDESQRISFNLLQHRRPRAHVLLFCAGRTKRFDISRIHVIGSWSSPTAVPCYLGFSRLEPIPDRRESFSRRQNS